MNISSTRLLPIRKAKAAVKSITAQANPDVSALSDAKNPTLDLVSTLGLVAVGTTVGVLSGMHTGTLAGIGGAAVASAPVGLLCGVGAGLAADRLIHDKNSNIVDKAIIGGTLLGGVAGGVLGAVVGSQMASVGAAIGLGVVGGIYGLIL